MRRCSLPKLYLTPGRDKQWRKGGSAGMAKTKAGGTGQQHYMLYRNLPFTSAKNHAVPAIFNL